MRRLIYRTLFLVVCAAAAAAPLCSSPSPSPKHTTPEWPSEFERRELYPLPLSEMEERFNAGFPGSVARFTDGERQFIFRWITASTRKLHSSADCFRGLGYNVSPAPALLDQSGAHWGCFTATQGAHRLRVRERIVEKGNSQAWTDASAWFWSVTLRQSRGPWLAMTIVENGP